MKRTLLLLALIAAASPAGDYLVLVPPETPGPGVFYGYFGEGELRLSSSPVNAVCAMPDNRDNLYIVFELAGTVGLPPGVKSLGRLAEGALVCDLDADGLQRLIAEGFKFMHLEPTLRAPRRAGPVETFSFDAEELIERVDLDRIDAYIYDLTRFRTRYAYTPQNREAGGYIAAELQKNGFEVTIEKWLGAQPQSLDAEGDLVAFSLASSHLFYSTDGGESFSEYLPAGGIKTWQNSICLVFPPSTVHFAGGDAYHRTRDGGASWTVTTFDLGSESNYISAMAFADEGTGYIFSASGGVWRTEDGGDTWVEVGGTGTEFFDALCPPGDPRKVIGVGRYETVFMSRDGGETWEKVHETSGGSTLFGAAFGDAERGLAVGAANRLLFTADGGETWTRSQIPGADTTLQLYAVAAAGALEYVVGSLYGEVFRTTDGGGTWQKLSTGRASTVNALAGDAANHRLWLVGKDGPAHGGWDLSGLTWRLEALDQQSAILWRNVIGEKRGEEYPESYVYGTAHFDSISGRREGDDPYLLAPGANDNGSGTTALLEISRVLADCTPRRTLVLAFFNAEELGLHGSYFHTRQLAYDGAAVDGAVNLDMVVWSDPPGEQEDLDIVTDYTSGWLADVLVEGCNRYSGGMPGKKLLEPDFYRSDHAPFWLVGYRAVLGIEDIDVPYPYYHTAEDDYPTIKDHLPLTEQVTRAALGALAGLAGIHDDDLYDLAGVYTYPNPFRGDRHSGVTFNGLVPGATLRVFDIGGNLVFETHSSGFELEWDVRNTAGRELAAGVYLYHISTPGGDAVTAKLAVIR